MFFKKLTIDGFKSFGQKTEIEFAKGVSVIVGPNGCGKSNVFDSIKWALGEQSARSLRGGRMSDVIFAGTTSHKPAPHCEVSIELSNASGLLPTDEDFLTVKRRLFRTGESEYLLNDGPARLRDIQRMMLGTGAGADSFAIMQQGKVDRVIHSKPADRRHIIEEAAGVAKYKVQKQEALARLARAEEDISRAGDLISEVSRNAGKLRQQAQRARDHIQFTAELRKREMILLALRREETRAEREAAEALCQQLQEQLFSFDDQIEEMASLNESRRGELEALAALLDELQAERDASLAEKGELGSRLASLSERLEQIAKRRERLAIEIEAEGKRGDSREEERGKLEIEINDLEVALREDGFGLERRQARLDALKEGMTDQEEELMNIRESLESLVGDKASLESEIKFARQMLEKLGPAGQGDVILEALRAEKDQTAQRAEETKAAAYKLQEECAQTTEHLDEKRKSLKEVEEKLVKVQKQREETLTALREARSRLGALQRLQENYEGFSRGVKEIMEAADAKELHQIVGVVASLLRPQQGMEAAMEVALGGAMQNIVVQTAEAGKEAIEFLKRRRAGRASMIPLDIIRPRDNDHKLNAIMRLPGVVGWATDLVDYDPRIEAAVFFLLGNTVVVEQLDVALALERKGFRTKYVTLDGDILNPGGLMTGGSHQTSGLMTRESEIQSLGSAAETLSRQLVEREEHLDKLSSSAGHLRQAVRDLETGLGKLQVGLVASVKDAEAAEKAAKQSAEKFGKFEEERFVAEDERTSYQEQVTFNREALADLDKQIAEARKRAEELGAQQGERGRRVAAATEEINALRLKAAAGQEKLKGLRTALERLGRDAETERLTAEQKRAEMDRLAEQDDQARLEMTELQSKLASADERFADVEARLKAQSEDRQGRASELRQLAERFQGLQRDRNLLQNELHQAEVEKAQRDSDLENLASQAAEKFDNNLDSILSELEKELTGLASDRADKKSREAASRESGGAEIVEIAMVAYEADDLEAPAGSSVSALSQKDQDDLDDEGQRAGWLEHPLAQLPQETLRAQASDLRASIEKLGAVNMAAIEEFEQIEERLSFLHGQKKDMDDAREAIALTIAKIDETTAHLFRDCFDHVREGFAQLFRRLFGGGKADLVLTEPENIHETGIEILAQPPGKKPQTISLLSGGEMCLTATALLFALFQWKPAPFCILDEIDAPLDDANVERFKTLIREFSGATQFIVISHNKLTMELADSILGVTMQEPGVSKIVSVRFDELEEAGLLADAPSTAVTHDSTTRQAEAAG